MGGWQVPTQPVEPRARKHWVAAHGIGTARAFQVSPTMGAFAGLAMGLAALFNALALPWLMQALLALLAR